MALPPALRDRLTLPAVCAPMFCVSGVDLVREAALAGLMAGLPRQNARDLEEFDAWLGTIRTALDRATESGTHARVGPLAVNLATRMDGADLAANLDICRRHGIEYIISAAGDPTELIARVHDWGGRVFHDVTSLRFAEKAIGAGADGLTCIGAGGGGHSGTVSHLALVPKVRSMFDGVILMAGAVASGAAIRAAEILGADLAYIGTRFIATRESLAAPAYKQMLVSQASSDLLFAKLMAGAPANWLTQSLRANGLDPDHLPQPIPGGDRYAHLQDGTRPWKTIWSAGQGIDLIDDVPSVAELVRTLRAEYVAACATSDMADAARLLPDRSSSRPSHA